MHKKFILAFLFFHIFIIFLCANPRVRIPFEITKDLIIIKLSVNSTDSLDFIFDTGQYGASIDSALSASLNLKHIDSGTVLCTSGTRQYYLTRCNYSLQDLQFDSIIWYISSFKKYSTILNRRIDGIIGYDLFRDYILYFDYDSHYLELYDRKFKKDWPGTRFSILDTLAPAIEGEITLLNGRKIKGKYVLDTGSNGGITLSSKYTDTTQILNLISDTVIKRYTTTCGTSMKTYDGNTRSFRIGPHRIDSIPVSLTTAKKGALAEGKYEGLIGTKVLKYYNFTIDVNNKIAIVEPNKSFKKAEKKRLFKRLWW